jgi:hypothetical protein
MTESKQDAFDFGAKLRRKRSTLLFRQLTRGGADRQRARRQATEQPDGRRIEQVSRARVTMVHRTTVGPFSPAECVNVASDPLRFELTGPFGQSDGLRNGHLSTGLE